MKKHKRISNWWRCRFNNSTGYCARYKIGYIEDLIIAIPTFPSPGNFKFTPKSKWNMFRLDLSKTQLITLQKKIMESEFLDNLTTAWVLYEEKRKQKLYETNK